MTLKCSLHYRTGIDFTDGMVFALFQFQVITLLGSRVMPTCGQFNHQFTNANSNDDVPIKRRLRKTKLTENKIIKTDGICGLIDPGLGAYQAENKSFLIAENLENVA